MEILIKINSFNVLLNLFIYLFDWLGLFFFCYEIKELRISFGIIWLD